MSRIGKQPVNIPEKVTVSVKDNVVVVKGPKGELSKPYPKEIGVVADAKVVNVTDLTEVRMLPARSRSPAPPALSTAPSAPSSATCAKAWPLVTPRPS